MDDLRYEYPEETAAGFADPQTALEALSWAGARKRYPEGVPEKVETSLKRELAIVAKLKYAPYFLTVADIVRFARSGFDKDGDPNRSDPVPGPRLGGQFRDLLLPGRHRSRSRHQRTLVRSLRLRRARRAARHRHRFRARAARGGDPVHLQEIRPRPRRAFRRGDLLSRPQRHPRSGEDVWFFRRPHRRAVESAALLVRRRQRARSERARARYLPIRI